MGHKALHGQGYLKLDQAHQSPAQPGLSVHAEEHFTSKSLLLRALIKSCAVVLYFFHFQFFNSPFHTRLKLHMLSCITSTLYLLAVTNTGTNTASEDVPVCPQLLFLGSY